MKNRKYLHIFYIDKFTLDFINFINCNFVSEEHLFLIFGKNYNIKFAEINNVIRLKKTFFDLFLLIKEMFSYKKIIFHGLFDKKIIFLLFLFPVIARKGYWVIWGGDLYEDDNKIKKKCVYEFVKKSVIKNIKGVMTCLDGDYELAKKNYGFVGTYNKCIMYPSNLFQSFEYFKTTSCNKRVILIGNSASVSNKHLEIFKKVQKFKNDNIEIICPLSYGDNDYREKILSYGLKIFGDKFNPILNFLPKNEYIKLLSRVDVAIFNHKRNQAMGNIISLIGLGKKVYIRSDITAWSFFGGLGIKVYNVNDLLNNLLENISCNVVSSNVCRVKEYFSEENLKRGWEKCFLD